MLTRAELDDDGFSSHTVDITGEGRANPVRSRGAKQASRGRRLQKGDDGRDLGGASRASARRRRKIVAVPKIVARAPL